MVQEIVTYMIIGAAITIAAMKLIKKFSAKKRPKKVDFSQNSFQMEHKCSDCSADCMLRNTIKTSVRLPNTDTFCKKIEIKSK